MERTSLLRETQPVWTLPLYVAHAARLRKRRRALEARLLAIGAADVTFVLCAAVEEVSRLEAARLRCVHPHYSRTRWSSASGRLSNGTLSLALKHRIAHWDIYKRGLSTALVIEDDAYLPSDLWLQISRYHVPADAHLFFLGSYSRNTSPHMTLSSAPQTLPPNKENGSLLVHRRQGGVEPLILGTVAYIVFARGAAVLQRPVFAEADVDMTLLTISQYCSASECTNTAPPNQYGPSQWLVWPVAQDENTHASGSQNSLQEKWKKWCSEMISHRRPLNKNCQRFGFNMKANH